MALWGLRDWGHHEAQISHVAAPCTADLQAADLKACTTPWMHQRVGICSWGYGVLGWGAGRRGVLLNPRPFKSGHTEYVGSGRPDVEAVESRGSRGTAKWPDDPNFSPSFLTG